MKINIDKVNKVVVATGYYKGYRVKSVVRCKENDEWNETFGVKLAKKQYKNKEREARLKYHNKIIDSLLKITDWCVKVIEDERNICDNLNDTIYNKNVEIIDFIASYEQYMQNKKF